MKNTGTLLSIFIAAAFTLPIQAEGDEGKDGPPVEFSTSLTGDVACSFAGGLRQGTAWLGMASVNATLNTGRAGLWKNGTFSVSGAHTLGSMPSSELFGDVQVSSNIEAGNHTFLMELWIRQRLGRVVITAGLQDLNTTFALSKSGGLYLNSSFGIMPVISCNIPTPIFPLTSPGLTLVWETSLSGSLAVALFDGRPIPFDSNPYNTRWKFDREDGLLAVIEYSHQVSINGYEGGYRIGLFSHNHLFDGFSRQEFQETNHSPTLGGYIIADQTLMRGNGREVALFLQAGYTPSPESFIDISAGLGINVSGLIRGREEDTAGLAVTAGRFRGNAGSETTLELTYKIRFGDHAYIQPDLQYIIRPSGSLSGIPHCLAGFMRLGVSF